MIGEKLLSMPRTVGEAKEIHLQLGLNCDSRNEYLFENARVLVQMNNEIYDKHQNITWLQERIDIIINER